MLRVLSKVPCVRRDSLSFCSMAVDIVCMEVSEVALNGAKRFAILEGYNANISIVAALWADSDGTRDASR